MMSIIYYIHMNPIPAMIYEILRHENMTKHKFLDILTLAWRQYDVCQPFALRTALIRRGIESISFSKKSKGVAAHSSRNCASNSSKFDGFLGLFLSLLFTSRQRFSRGLR